MGKRVCGVPLRRGIILCFDITGSEIYTKYLLCWSPCTILLKHLDISCERRSAVLFKKVLITTPTLQTVNTQFALFFQPALLQTDQDLGLGTTEDGDACPFWRHTWGLYIVDNQRILIMLRLLLYSFIYVLCTHMMQIKEILYERFLSKNILMFIMETFIYCRHITV